MKLPSLSLAGVGLIVIGFLGCHGAPAPSKAPVASISDVSNAPSSSLGQWRVISSVNELDGKKKVSVNGHYVHIRCSPKLEGFIVPPLTNLGGRLQTTTGYSQTVRYRLDSGPIKTESWSVSDGFDALFFPPATLRAIAKAKTMILEYNPEYETETTGTFDLGGLSEALKSAGCEFPVLKSRASQELVRLPGESDSSSIDPSTLPLCSEVAKAGTSDYPSCRAQ